MDVVKTLSYAPALPLHRRLYYKAFKWTLLAGLATAAIVSGPAAFRWVEFLYWQHACMTYNAPPNAVAVRYGSQRNTKPFANVPARWKLEDLTDQSLDTAPTLFLHQVTRPDGQIRLVSVTTEYTRVWTPASFGKAAQCQTYSWCAWDAAGEPSGQVIYEGHIDPSNSDHFTVDYQAPDGTRTTADGYLDNTDQVLLDRRVAPTKSTR